MNSRRWIILLYVVVLGGFGVGAGALFLDAHAHYTQLKRTEQAKLRRLADANAQLAEQKRILERLRSDPEFMEKALRKWGYGKPGEVIFRFEE